MEHSPKGPRLSSIDNINCILILISPSCAAIVDPMQRFLLLISSSFVSLIPLNPSALTHPAFEEKPCGNRSYSQGHVGYLEFVSATGARKPFRKNTSRHPLHNLWSSTKLICVFWRRPKPPVRWSLQQPMTRCTRDTPFRSCH